MPKPAVQKKVAVKTKNVNVEDPAWPLPPQTGTALGVVRKEVGAKARPKKRKKGSRGTY